MADSKSKTEKLEHPAEHYASPRDIVEDETLSDDEKEKALDTWEQDARQMLTASNEGMPGSAEGQKPSDRPRLAEVLRAKEAIGAKPKRKPAQ
jgi:hypothetical protein